MVPKGNAVSRCWGLMGWKGLLEGMALERGLWATVGGGQ